jgi:hypothetical protein
MLSALPTSRSLRRIGTFDCCARATSGHAAVLPTARNIKTIAKLIELANGL